MDAGYGNVTEFREELVTRDLLYVAGIQAEVSVWQEGTQAPAPKAYEGRGRRPTLLRRSKEAQPVSVTALAHALPKSAWRSLTWRSGTKGGMGSRFAMVRVRAAHRDYWRSELRAEEWLLVEWPPREKEPTKFWLSNVAADATMKELVHLAKLRWRIERDYQELKDEIGIDHYEGRGWVGFHHHAALCIAAYAFLIAERARLFPPEPLAFLEAPAVPEGFRPRGRPAAS